MRTHRVARSSSPKSVVVCGWVSQPLADPGGRRYLVSSVTICAWPVSIAPTTPPPPGRSRYTSTRSEPPVRGSRVTLDRRLLAEELGRAAGERALDEFAFDVSAEVGLRSGECRNAVMGRADPDRPRAQAARARHRSRRFAPRSRAARTRRWVRARLQQRDGRVEVHVLHRPLQRRAAGHGIVAGACSSASIPATMTRSCWSRSPANPSRRRSSPFTAPNASSLVMTPKVVRRHTQSPPDVIPACDRRKVGGNISASMARCLT